jgi:hypothetical protein
MVEDLRQRTCPTVRGDRPLLAGGGEIGEVACASEPSLSPIESIHLVHIQHL